MAGLACTLKAMRRTVRSGARPQELARQRLAAALAGIGAAHAQAEKFVWFQNPVPIEQTSHLLLFVPFNKNPTWSDMPRVTAIPLAWTGYPLSMGLSEWIAKYPTWTSMQPAAIDRDDSVYGRGRFIYPTSTSVQRASQKLAPAGVSDWRRTGWRQRGLRVGPQGLRGVRGPRAP